MTNNSKQIIERFCRYILPGTAFRTLWSKINFGQTAEVSRPFLSLREECAAIDRWGGRLY